MGSATETLCGQAFGAGQVNMLGVYMQRSWVILSVTSILLLPIYIFAGPILKFLGQQEDIADLAGSFSILVIPQFLSLPFNFPTQKFLQAQSKVKVIALRVWVWANAQGHILSILLYVFVVCDLMYREIWNLPMQFVAYFSMGYRGCNIHVARYAFIVYVRRYVSSVEVKCNVVSICWSLVYWLFRVW